MVYWMEGGTSTLCLVKKSEGTRTAIGKTVRGFMCCLLHKLVVALQRILHVKRENTLHAHYTRIES